MLKYLVEFLGTLIFLYVIIATNGNPYAVGLILTTVILIGGNISGGNFNPAVSVMMVLANKLKITELIPYVLSQVLGALCAFKIYSLTK
jgi:aquaporin Z